MITPQAAKLRILIGGAKISGVRTWMIDAPRATTWAACAVAFDVDDARLLPRQDRGHSKLRPFGWLAQIAVEDIGDDTLREPHR